MRVVRGLGLVLAWLAAPALAAAHQVWCVDDDAPPGGNGFSWILSFRSLQDALAVAHPDDVITLAGGTYRPDRGAGYTPGDRHASFVISDDRMIVGGYRGLAGGGSPTDRDPRQFVSILSGDLAGDDPSSTLDNSRRVVVVGGGAGHLDGLTVTGGRFEGGHGAGVAVGPHALFAIDCTFRGNDAGAGAAIHASGGTLELQRCRFETNQARQGGAGISIAPGTAALDACAFVGNVAQSGGGGAIFAEEASLQLTRCTFVSNRATTGGGLLARDAWLDVEETTFDANVCAGQPGGAIALEGGGGTAAVRRSSFRLNGGASAGGAIASDGPVLTLELCRFEGNQALSGGAVATTAGTLLDVRDSTFVGNRGSIGGAVRGRQGRLTRCHFAGNQAGTRGGAVAIDPIDPGALLPILDCAFIDNQAIDGAALFFAGNAPGSRLELLGATAADNRGSGGGTGAIHCAAAHAGALVVRGAILHGNAAGGAQGEAAQLSGATGAIAIDHSTVMGWSGARGGVGNDGHDPRFVDPLGGNWRLRPDSPAIETGDPAFFPAAGNERDVEGNVRLTDGDLDRVARVDRGAFEFAQVRLEVLGDFVPGGFLDVVTSGQPGLTTLLIVGTLPTTLDLIPLGHLFVDPATTSLYAPWPAAPSQVRFNLPADLPPTSGILQLFVSQGDAGNLSNAVAIEIH